MTQAQVRDLTRLTEEKTVIIDEVNMTQFYISAKDAYGSVYQIGTESWPAIVAIPAPGETWAIARRKTSWYLVRRLEVGKETTAITKLKPGDSRIEAANDLYLNGARILLNEEELTTAHLAPLDSPAFTGDPTAPTASVDTNTTQIATTQYVIGQASSSLPAMDGSATIGTSKRYARGDHAHPSDISRAPLDSPSLTGTPTAPTAGVDTNTAQIATTAFVIAQASSATPLMDGTATTGTSVRYSRADHVHPTDTSRTPKITTGSLAAGPPSSPSDGDIWIATYVDTLGTCWQFQYNNTSGSPYKWEWIGGGSYASAIAASETATGTGWQDLSTVGPTYVTSRDGDWAVEYGARFTSATFDTRGFIGIKVGTAIAGLPQVGIDTHAGGIGELRDFADAITDPNLGAIPSGTTIRVQYWVNVTGCSFYWRKLRIRPIRIS